MEASISLNTLFLLDDEKSQTISFDNGVSTTLGELASIYQEDDFALGVDDFDGRLIQKVDVMIFSKTHHLNANDVFSRVTNLTKGRDIERAKSALEANADRIITNLQLIETLTGNEYATQLIEQKIGVVDNEACMELVYNLSDIAENNFENNPNLFEKDKTSLLRVANFALQKAIDLSVEDHNQLFFEAYLKIIILFPNAEQIITDAFIESGPLRNIQNFRREMLMTYGDLARSSEAKKKSCLDCSRNVMESTRSLSFISSVAPYLKPMDFYNIKNLLNQNNNQTIQAKDFWKKEARYITIILIEASLRNDLNVFKDIFNTSISNLSTDTIKHLLLECNLDRRNVETLQKILVDSKFSSDLRMFALGHLARILPDSYANKVAEIIKNLEYSLGLKSDVLYGINGQLGLEKNIVLRDAILHEMKSVKGTRKDVQLSEEEFKFVVICREVLIKMEGDDIDLQTMRSFLDPVDELNRRLRARGPRGHIEQISEGPLDTSYYSEFGFLAEKENLDDIVEKDTKTLNKYGLTFNEVAEPMTRIRDHYFKTRETTFYITINNQKYKVQASAPFLWHQSSPFADNTNTGENDFTVTDVKTGEEFFFFGLFPYLIKYHHFFEGDIGNKEQCYRIEPENVISFFRIRAKH